MTSDAIGTVCSTMPPAPRRRAPSRPALGAPSVADVHRALVHARGGAEVDLTGAPMRLDFSGRAIADAKAAIRDSLEPFDAIQTLSSIIAFSTFGPAETYSEPNASPSGRIEYIASTLLEAAEPGGLRVMSTEQTNRAAGAIQRALDAADEIARNTIFTILSKAEGAEDPLQRIAAHLQLLDAGVRGPGYEGQAKELLAELFADPILDAALTRTIGFTAAQSVALEEALTRLVQTRFNNTLRMIELITAHRQEIAFQIQRRAEYILCITRDELAAAAGTSANVTGAFLERFSVGFGESGRAHLLTGQSAIRRRPFVRAPDARYLLTSPVNLLWAIQPALEAALKDEPEWETFQQRRAAFVEVKVAGALAEAVRADVRHVNLRFTVDGGPLYEIDGVVIVDDVAFVLEAKAGRLSVQARRGRLRELRPELERLLGRGASQAARLRTAILTGANVEFFDADGGAVDVPLAQVRRVEAVVVTLEDLSWLVALRGELVEAGLVNAEEDIPWIVSVFDFEIVCRLIEFPAQLTLYLKARRALPGQITPGDELNLWMMHLLTMLAFPPDAGRVSLRGDWTEEIDRHYMFGHGALPKMPLGRRARSAVEQLDRAHTPGHVRATEELIERDQQRRLPKPAVVMRRDATAISMYAKNP
jgi:hypothetical protein